MGRLIGDIREASSLSEQQKREMFGLLALHFEHVDRAAFVQDLSEKQWVITLEDCATAELKGFSTQMLLDVSIGATTVKALFSGDTIIHKQYWGEQELAMTWHRLVLGLIGQYPRQPLYWFLICKGYKTYRFLPVFFREFYPRFDRATPVFEQDLMDAFGRLKYPEYYEKLSGVIKVPRGSMSLKPGIADIGPRRLRDPHVRFFAERNPGHIYGEELVCIAEVSPANFNPRVSARSRHCEILDAER